MKYLFVILLLVPIISWSQSSEDEPKVVIGGYVKNMTTFNFAEKDSTLVDNLIHNRINITWFASTHLRGKLELRNRVFFGDLVNLYPNYGELIDTNNDYFDLSWTPINRDKLVIHTMIDRANLRWTKNDLEITLGRQRVNWGVNLAWNPNDLFNSYSFFDFDYEERPGSDALRIKKYTGFASEMEFVIKATDRFETLTTAYKYQLNKWGYDIQFIGGLMKNNIAVGTGWAGSIQGLGFKGEITYLNHLENTEKGWLASTSVDYLFPNSLYVNASALFNGYGTAQPVFSVFNTSSNLDIRNISPYTWSTFIQSSYPFHPLVNIGLATIFFPSDASVFINPSITYAIIQNLDLDVISQLYFSGDRQNSCSSQAKVFYVRIKYSY